MTSKSSIYKMTKEHLRHSSWMIALSFIGNLLAGPVIQLFEYSNRDYEYMKLNSTAEVYSLFMARNSASGLSHLCGSSFLGIAMLGALIVALGIFYYLFQSSKVDLYHSLPLTRKELFYSGYLAGFLIWLVPFLISSIITLPIAIFCAGGLEHINMILVAFLKMLIIPLIGFIIIYHLCLVAVMISGNMSNAIIAILVWGLAPLVFYGLFTVHFEHYFDTFYQFTIAPELLCGLSPIATPIFIQATTMDGSGPSTFLTILILGLIIATANFFVARSLYQKRKSELAGRGMEHKAATSLIRFVSAFAAGLFGVIFLYFLGVSRNRMVWSIFFSLFFSVFTSAVLSAVQKKTVKGLFAHKLQMVITAAAAIGFILICRFDILGYDSYLPDKDNIENIEIRISATADYYYYNDPDFYTYNNTDAIYDILQAGTEDTSYEYATSVIVKVNPVKGFSYYRRYQIPINRTETLRPIIEDDNYFAFLYKPFLEGVSEFGGMNLRDMNRNYAEIHDEEQTKGLWQAYYTDMSEHRTMEEMTNYARVGDLDFTTKEDSDYHYNLWDLPVPENYKHTIAYLKEYYPHLVFSKEDLNVKHLTIYFDLREELSVEEYFLENLTPALLEERMNSYTGDYIVQETVSISEYQCELSAEELTWLYEYLHPSNHVIDGLNTDSYFYIGEMELYTGNQIGCYIEKGSMTEEEIKLFAEMVQQKSIKIEY